MVKNDQMVGTDMRERKLPPVTCVLVAANILLYIYVTVRRVGAGGVPTLYQWVLYPFAVMYQGEYYRLFTSMFMHFGASHLMHNMLMLFLIGQRMEDAAGSFKTLLIYVLSGLGANLFSLWYYEHQQLQVFSAGASGAIMGMIGALFACILKNRRSLGGIDRHQMLILIVFSLYSGFVSSSTNNAAHISGMLFGFLLGMLLCRPKESW